MALSGGACWSDDYSLTVHWQLTVTPTGTQELMISLSSIADMLYESIETFEWLNSRYYPVMAVVSATDRVTVTIADIEYCPDALGGAGHNGGNPGAEHYGAGGIEWRVGRRCGSIACRYGRYSRHGRLYLADDADELRLLGGETSVEFDITAAVDGIYEGDPETLILTLSTTNSTVLNGNLVRTLTITDLDTQPTLSVEGVMNVSEGAGTLTLTARLDGALNIPVPIMLSTGGTATENEGYTFPSSLTMPAGVRVLTIAITIIDDDVHENDETVEFTLSVPGGEVLTSTVMGTFTIMNDYQVPGVMCHARTHLLRRAEI